MKNFQITIYDDFFKKEYVGHFTAKTEKAAIKKCKEIYAHELDTIPSEIQIVKIEQI